jgi:hypothetical protein
MGVADAFAPSSVSSMFCGFLKLCIIYSGF